MADVLAESVGLRGKTPFLELMKTNRLISVRRGRISFNVFRRRASCMQNKYSDFEFGDIGVLLAGAISGQPEFVETRGGSARRRRCAQPYRRGNYSMNVSGSTNEYTAKDFPVKNLPVARIKLETGGE
jgi:ethanolamine utilization protein EutA